MLDEIELDLLCKWYFEFTEGILKSVCVSGVFDIGFSYLSSTINLQYVPAK